MRIGIIGAGKVGWTIGKYFSTEARSGTGEADGYTLSGYFNRTAETAIAAAAFTGSKAYASAFELVADSDLVFLTVSDGAIAEVFDGILTSAEDESLAGKYFFHCSGALGYEVLGDFDDLEALGIAGVGSAHPLFAISDREKTWEKMNSVYWTIEGTVEAVAVLENLFAVLGNPVAKIYSYNKPLYHAASAVVSNLVVGAAYIGEELYKESGLPQDFASEAWKSLFIENANNIANKGVAAALTGPVERGDVATVAKHLQVLQKSEYREAYVELSKALLKVAKISHPDRDDSKLEELLNADF
ncbi:MAG: DUF2520 domain-containing protein [Clostridiales Family XIII bacterium]|jgi:predicted short-subunit dehydrogenase-like oxidoreductase (DUF2520 family)|nr:DUF2520 domain-containing protein [Clostridiales Family XIII bacterium]